MTCEDKGSYDSTPLCIKTSTDVRASSLIRKRATNYRALLRNTTCEDKGSYDSTPLCIKTSTDVRASSFILYFKCSHPLLFCILWTCKYRSVQCIQILETHAMTYQRTTYVHINTSTDVLAFSFILIHERSKKRKRNRYSQCSFI